MNAPVATQTIYVSPPEAPTLSELDRVMLTADARTDEGDIVPAGTEGTVVAIWNGGSAYEVDFTKPRMATASVRADNLRKLA